CFQLRTLRRRIRPELLNSMRKQLQKPSVHGRQSLPAVNSARFRTVSRAHEQLHSDSHTLDVTARNSEKPNFGHDFSRVRVLSHEAVSDQTQSGGLDPKFTQGGSPAPASTDK